MSIRDIENHLERADARIARAYKLDAIREKDRVRRRIIKAGAAIIAVACAVYAVCQQF